MGLLIAIGLVFCVLSTGCFVSARADTTKSAEANKPRMVIPDPDSPWLEPNFPALKLLDPICGINQPRKAHNEWVV